MRADERGLILLGGLGFGLVGGLLWLIENTRSPAVPVMTGALLLVAGLVVTPWILLVRRRLGDDPGPARVFRRAVVFAAWLGLAGVVLAVTTRDRENASVVVAVSIIVSGGLALVGGVLIPWIFVLARTVTRERAARALAEERAAVAAHLHDSVLQSLTLIQKRTAEPEVLRLARGTERELRAWLDGSKRGGDLASAVTATAEEIEDRFAVRVELVTAGTCALDERAEAVVGAVREALTNAAKHARVPTVSALVEVDGGEVYALVRDAGRGFDPAVDGGGRGIAGSIVGRLRQHGGDATVQSEVGSGTLVELRLPL